MKYSSSASQEKNWKKVLHTVKSQVLGDQDQTERAIWSDGGWGVGWGVGGGMGGLLFAVPSASFGHIAYCMVKLHLFKVPQFLGFLR